MLAKHAKPSSKNANQPGDGSESLGDGAQIEASV